MCQGKKSNIILVRHGESKANVESRNNPNVWFDLENQLTGSGREQIKKIGGILKEMNVNEIYCSNTIRARDSAKIIAKEIGQKIKEEVEGLIEQVISSEKLNEEQLEELINCWKQGKDFKFKGGETVCEFKDRILKELEKHYSSNKTIVIVTHAGVISVVCAYFSGQDFIKARTLSKDINYGEGRVLEFKDSKLWSLHKLPKDNNFYLTLPYRKTCVLIVRKMNDILVVHKKDHSEAIWTLPAGGRLNFKENQKETIKRELLEELNISNFKITKKLDYIQRFNYPENFRGHKGFRGAEMQFFLVELGENNIKLDEKELDRWKFVPVKEIEKHIDFDFEYGYGKKLIEYIK
jgi:alpha-ribazole phosphatase